MELCPRCTSTVVDHAPKCPRCGADLWQPSALARQVAVTPAPVALVLPSPAPAPGPATAAVPPPLPVTALPATPPPLPAAQPAAEQLSLPVAEPVTEPVLPPQRIASPEPEPAAAVEPAPRPVSPVHADTVHADTVIPATPPAARKPHHLAVGVGVIATLLAVVVLIVALPARGSKPNDVAVVASNADAQFDLRALAAAEETSLTATETYSTDSAALAAAGYQPAPGRPVTINAGISKSGYCLVATAGSADAPWYLYDSKQGGLVTSSFAAEALAQDACADSAIKTYQPIA